MLPDVKMLYKILLFSALLLVLAVISGGLYLRQAKFGRLPQGKRLDRLAGSPNYRDGTFRNREPVAPVAEGGSGLALWLKFLLRDGAKLTPPGDVPTVRTDLKALPPNGDVVVWLGHSSYFIRLGGRKFLIDPVFSDHASPVSFSTRAFEGTTIYGAEDMPDIDYLLISHDHWDHLDHATVTALRPRIGQVITGLGVGEHFARWGFPEEMIVEADWDDVVRLEGGIAVHVLPARHFSGRLIDRNRTLWVSFALETPERRVYYSGDSGYGSHFLEIGERFGGFDLALLDSGQYNEAWRDVHMTPEQAVRAAEDLRAEAALPSHAGRFSIAFHSWDDPFKRFVGASGGKPFRPVTPRIGERVDLGREQVFSRWWEPRPEEDAAQ